MIAARDRRSNLRLIPSRRMPSVGSERMKHMGFIIFISLFFLVGLGLLGKGLYSYWQGRRALMWPTTEGRILECKVLENSDGEDSTWEVKALFSYAVDGREFQGNRIGFGYARSGAREEHQAIYDKLPQGSRVLVRYDPGDPNSSVLAAGFNRSIFLTLAFAVTWLLFITGFTVIWFSASGRDLRILEQIQVIK
jgi:hypothetical protein